ncbi:hypothetical protein HF521_000280 [Silurus meridionalis]|uniref:Protein Wnt n=1 Tax=Silurus meridionalis TaxID=175797 RepID=A0A8T0BVZ3_SILME|nr:hypothetical protein HF521_000280 [Silurus meridionalis]
MMLPTQAHLLFVFTLTGRLWRYQETAFVNGIMAAGVLHAVTRACSQGELLQCGCVSIKSSSGSPNEQAIVRSNPALPDQRWEWGGCGDDVDFGDKISRQFMDTRKRKAKSDIRSLIDLHNNEAGRLAVKTNMRTECKCHGLSGSCTLRSCWSKLPLFRQVGNHLMQSFQTAVRVMGGNDGKSLVPLDRELAPLGSHSLIYSDETPDFCVANRRTGSEGTRDRVCNGTETGPGACDWLCCNKGHTEHTLEYEENCQCHFQWCCEVQCERCAVRKVVNVCL